MMMQQLKGKHAVITGANTGIGRHTALGLAEAGAHVTSVHIHSLHPGVVATDIWRRLPRQLQPLIKLFMISPEEGAQTTLHCALSPEAGETTGLYWDSCKVRKPSRLASDQELARELWEKSEAWVG